MSDATIKRDTQVRAIFNDEPTLFTVSEKGLVYQRIGTNGSLGDVSPVDSGVLLDELKDAHELEREEDLADLFHVSRDTVFRWRKKEIVPRVQSHLISMLGAIRPVCPAKKIK